MNQRYKADIELCDSGIVCISIKHEGYHIVICSNPSVYHDRRVNVHIYEDSKLLLEKFHKSLPLAFETMESFIQ